MLIVKSSDIIAMKDVAKWREENLKTQPPELAEALGQWQGCNHAMNRTLNVILETGSDMSVVSDVVKIWTALERAPLLPKGTVLWRAVRPTETVPARNPRMWLAVAVSMDGAVAWARKNLTDGKANICKIVVADDSVRALAVGTDSFYENEKEILVAPDFTIKTVDTPTNTTLGNGNPVLLFEIRGPGEV